MDRGIPVVDNCLDVLIKLEIVLNSLCPTLYSNKQADVHLTMWRDEWAVNSLTSK